MLICEDCSHEMTDDQLYCRMCSCTRLRKSKIQINKKTLDEIVEETRRIQKEFREKINKKSKYYCDDLLTNEHLSEIYEKLKNIESRLEKLESKND